MNKAEFLQKLRENLSELPEEEIQNAISYYAEYIDDYEGEENDAVAELETPEIIAEQIISDYSGRSDKNYNNYNKGRVPNEEKDDKEYKYNENSFVNTGEYKYYQNSEITNKGGFPTVLKIIILIFLFPVFLGLVIAAFSILVSFWICVVVFGIISIFSLVMSIISFPVNAAAGLLLLGTFLALMGLCILCFIGVCALSRITFRGIGWCFRQITSK